MHDMSNYELQDRPGEFEQEQMFKGTAILAVFVGFVLLIALAVVIGPFTFVVAPALTIAFAAWFHGKAVENTCKKNMQKRLEREEA